MPLKKVKPPLRVEFHGPLVDGFSGLPSTFADCAVRVLSAFATLLVTLFGAMGEITEAGKDRILDRLRKK